MSLSHLDLNLLVALDALLTERNVTRAGQRIGVTQPTMSRALSRLRRTLGDPLLVRVGRDMQLTPRAVRLAPRVREILELTKRAIDDRSDFDPAHDARGFSVSCSDYVTLVLMCLVVDRLAVAGPNVELHLVPRSADARGLLRRAEVDVVIEPAALMNAKGLSSAPLFSDRWRCGVWSGSKLARGTLDAKRFVAAPYLTYTLGTGRITNLADRLLAEQGIDREPRVTTENFALVPFLLRGTNMVSLVLERGVTAFGDSIDITLRTSPIELPVLVETMYWNPRHNADPGGVRASGVCPVWVPKRYGSSGDEAISGSGPDGSGVDGLRDAPDWVRPCFNRDAGFRRRRNRSATLAFGGCRLLT